MSTTERNIAEDGGARRTIFIIVGAVSLLLIVGLFFWIRSAGSGGNTAQAEPRLEGGIRAGTPEFEQYRQKIVMDKPEATEAKRALGDIVITPYTTVRNFTGRTINGLEMYAAVVDMQGRPVRQRTVIVIPTRRAELDNNETLPVSIPIDRLTDADDRADIKMEITAIKFK